MQETPEPRTQDTADPHASKQESSHCAEMTAMKNIRRGCKNCGSHQPCSISAANGKNIEQPGLRGVPNKKKGRDPD